MISITKLLLKEYSDKLINQMVELYSTQTQDSKEQIIQNIKRFEQVRDSIAKKLQDGNPILLKLLPQELQQNNKFRDVTLYRNYETLVNVIKASSKQIDPYKQAIEYFKKRDEFMNPSIIGNYVARFKQNLNQLIQNVNEKDEQTLRSIPKQLLQKDLYKDITNWRDFHTLEVMLDTLFPLEVKSDDSKNDAQSDGDLIYSKDGLEIYKGDEEHKCVRYGKGYGWCIGRGMYPSYRYMQSNAKMNRAFYFIFDRNLSKNDKYHAVVLHSFAGGGYTRTTAVNGDETQPMTWQDMGSKLFSNTESGKMLWNKIKGMESLFKFIPPNKDEQRRLGFRGVRKTFEEFINLDEEDRIDWLRANGSNKNIITTDIAKSLTIEERNELINYDYPFTYNELKDNRQLMRRYAEYHFSRRPDKPLPAVFLPFLKEESKQRYFDKYWYENLTAEYTEKYLGEEFLNQYLDKYSKQYGYIPLNYIEKIPDEKWKKFYSIYSKLYQNWEYSSTSMNDDKVNNSDVMPSQSVDPRPLFYQQFKNFSSNEKQNIIKLINLFESDKEKYDVLGYSVPFLIKSSKGDLFLLPTKKDENSYNNWVLCDINGNIILNGINGDNSTIGQSELGSGYPSSDDEYKRIFNINELKVDGEPLKLKEAIYEQNNFIKQLKYRAGIIS